MDWTNERYVRAYTRDTADYLVLGWQARGLWWEVLRKADRSGVIATNHGPRGIAALVRWPLEVVEPALTELLADGCVQECDGGYVLPNYIDANESPSSNAQRKRESREQRRLQKVTNRDQKSRAVTRGHAESHGVTPSLAEPNLTDPIQEEERSASPPPLALVSHVSPRATKAKAPSGPHQEAVAHFEELFRSASNGQRHDWRGKSGKLMADLVKEHGVTEVKRRTSLLFAGKGPAWLKPPFTVGTLSSQWNHLAIESQPTSRASTSGRFEPQPDLNLPTGDIAL